MQLSISRPNHWYGKYRRKFLFCGSEPRGSANHQLVWELSNFNQKGRACTCIISRIDPNSKKRHKSPTNSIPRCVTQSGSNRVVLLFQLRASHTPHTEICSPNVRLNCFKSNEIRRKAIRLLNFHVKVQQTLVLITDQRMPAIRNKDKVGSPRNARSDRQPAPYNSPEDTSGPVE